MVRDASGLLLRLGAGVVVGQDAVDRAPRLVEDGEGLRGLLVVPETGDLLHRGGERHRAVHQSLDPLARAVLGDLPGLAELVRVLLDVAPPLVGEVEDLAAVGVRRGDEALVLQLLQHRVHRAGARPPETAAALPELIHDRVAVARLLREQGENGGADVAATPPPATAVTAPATGAEAGTEARTTGTEARTPGTETRPTGTEPGRARTEARTEPCAAGTEASARAERVPAEAVPAHRVEHMVPHSLPPSTD